MMFGVRMGSKAMVFIHGAKASLVIRCSTRIGLANSRAHGDGLPWRFCFLFHHLSYC